MQDPEANVGLLHAVLGKKRFGQFGEGLRPHGGQVSGEHQAAGASGEIRTRSGRCARTDEGLVSENLEARRPREERYSAPAPSAKMASPRAASTLPSRYKAAEQISTAAATAW